ncbi:MAG TPA: hypothetical protein VHS97_10820 [Isosphaeraceae bacterium]|jgi:hypothetical protein|nr:hypothetical protein [Isosphaeraceae bacterium]
MRSRIAGKLVALVLFSLLGLAVVGGVDALGGQPRRADRGIQTILTDPAFAPMSLKLAVDGE